MDRALVVVEPSETGRDLIREAGELAAGVGASLVLLDVRGEDAVESDMETLETIAEVESISFGEATVLDAVERSARDAGHAVLDDLDVEFEAVGAVADDGEADEILDVAETYDCDHVFLAGRKRSPTGKALFGDTAQSVLLNFDGRVTVSLE